MKEHFDLNNAAGGAVVLDTRQDVSNWHPAKRIGFRFVFGYLVLYNFPFPLAFDSLPVTGYLIEKYNALWQVSVPWVGKHLLRLSYDITVFTNGSGDTTYNYVQALCFLILAAVATVVWSSLDRRRVSYERLHQWLTIYIRFSLASSMILYGIIKLIPPLQFSAPSLSRLLQPYGDSSPMGLLWTFMGASESYTNFTGLIETMGGLLLLIPRTARLGAIVSLAAMTQVFALNMCYDVPVKLYSFHLLLMSAFLVAPVIVPLIDLLIFNRPVDPVRAVPLFKRERLNQIAPALQIALGLCLIVLLLWQNHKENTLYGDIERSPMYGIWSVEEFKIDGETKPPLITDETRWRRVVFDDFNWFAVQLMSGSRERFIIDLDMESKAFTLNKRGDPEWKAEFALDQRESETLTLSGNFDDRQIQVKLRREDAKEFLLTSRGFHWIQEYPFNR